MLFRAQISQEISDVVGRTLENISMNRSINAISSQLKSFSKELKPSFDELFHEYGLELVNFSFYNLTIDETEERKKYIDRRVAAANVADARYNQAVQQELLKDIAVNPGAGGLAGAGAGLGIGLAAGSAFASMSSSTFSQQQVPVTPAQSDPMEVLGKLKKTT